MKLQNLVCAVALVALCFYSALPKIGGEYNLGGYTGAETVAAEDYGGMYGAGGLSSGPRLNYLKVKGERAFFPAGELSAEEVIAFFGARVVFTEEACGVLSYYCRSPHITGAQRIRGREVNLHVAVSEGGVTVGTPVIYGSF